MKIIGDGSNRISFVNVEDLADVFVSAVSKGSGVYVVSGECRSQKEVYEIACRELGVDSPKESVSAGAADFMAGLGELKTKLFGGKPKITREHVAILSSDRCFNCNKARRELGFSPRSLEEGIAEMAKRLSTEP